jgi:hypothetical protein
MITINGCSDDIIEIGGDIDDELYAVNADSDGDILAFSDGTVLRITYDGVWRISPIVDTHAVVSVVQCPEDDERNYSDVATLRSPISWVVLGSGIVRP